ncbi:MAG: GatB/YqeY domain-containing protein [Candidatus Jorgensenbacteria bacterium]|nr:GatB/YqeY domain-containing protein [Candidatus Jorgensenbacteria bacterium]
MALVEQIKRDFETAFKARETVKMETLRLLRSAFHNREIEKRGKGSEPVLTEEEALEVLRREAKKRKEASEMFLNGGRKELAEKELKELAVLEAYLPAQITEADLRRMVDEALKNFPGATQKDVGKLMGFVMKQAKGNADGALVGRIIQEKLAQ